MSPWGGADKGADETAYFSDDPVDYREPKRDGVRRSPKKGLALFVLLITSSLFVGNTLSANIAINGGRLEFGQGVARYKACSDNLVVKQNAQFSQSGFKLKSIEISNIPVACYGLNLIISILKPGVEGTGELATLFGSVTRLRVYDRSGTFYTSQADSSYVTLTSTNNPATSTDTVLITFNTASVLVTDIGTLGVESSANTLTSLPCGAGGDCAVGAVGPGGGAVILYQEAAFTAAGSPCDLDCHGIEMDTTNGATNYIDTWAENASGVSQVGSVGQGATGFGAGYANTKRAMTSANASLGNTTRNGAIAYCWNKTTSSATDRWYLPSVMEYAHIFKKVSDSAAFRTAWTDFPAATDYYSSEEAWSGWDSGYQAIWNAGGPPAGVALAITAGNGTTDRALSVEPALASGAMVNSTYANYAKLKIWAHPKNAGYAVLCLRAFK